MWEERGLFDREVGYYQALRRRIGDIVFVTYDTPNPELEQLQQRVSLITVLTNHLRLHCFLYSILAPIIHRKSLRHAAVFKSNQLSGAWTAAIASLVYRKPLVVRCGYVDSLWRQRQGQRGLRFWTAFLLERLSVRVADMVFTASEADRQYLSSTHGVPSDRIYVIPNPIDTDRFYPAPEKAEPGTVLYVGRFSEQKNVHLLVEACERIPEAKLTLVGSGPLEPKLRRLANPEKVTFAGVVPNRHLPAVLQRAQVFVLPSQYEGTPKALLEAMACGLAVVGTNVPGIRELIQDGVNGLLCEPDVKAISEAIARLLNDAELRARLGRAARRFVEERYAQSKVVETEARLLTTLMA